MICARTVREALGTKDTDWIYIRLFEDTEKAALGKEAKLELIVWSAPLHRIGDAFVDYADTSLSVVLLRFGNV